MKALFLNNYHYLRGGSEQVFFGEMDILRSYGHDVKSYARKSEHDILSDFYDKFPLDIKTDSLSIGFGAIKTLKEIVYSAETKKKMRQILLEYIPDVAHAHNIYGRLTTSVLDILRKMNIPVVMTLHDYKIVCPSYKLMYRNRICEDCKGKKFYHAILNRCHKNSIFASSIYAFESWFNQFFDKYNSNVNFFISPSLFLKEKLIEFGWPKERIVYIPNFIVFQNFIPSYDFEEYLLYIGRLSVEKGVSTLIQAFKKLGHKRIKLLICGDGPERKRLENLSAGDDRIEFTGYLSGEELSRVTRLAKGVIVPSEWYENAPLSILEAFAYGKPVIGARIGGIPEMIDDGINGLIFEATNVDDLKNKMELFICKSKNEILDMGKAAREKVEQRFSSEAHYQQLMLLYKKVRTN
jgi:glycosyltransferase involved in cell wall biosynthesis